MPDSERAMAEDGAEELTPATREELVEGLAFAMRYKGRRRVHDDLADSFMARIAAERLVDWLEGSRFVVLKRPPAPPISDSAHHRRPPLTE